MLELLGLLGGILQKREHQSLARRGGPKKYVPRCRNTMYPYTPDPHTQTFKSCTPYTPPVPLRQALATLLAAALADRGSPFFSGRHEWAGHVFDWAEAQREQAYWDRYENHAEECICGICYWMGAATAEDCVGNSGSRNVFLNGMYDYERSRLIEDLLEDLAFCKFLWDSLGL